MATLNSFAFAYILVWILKLVIVFFVVSLTVLFIALGIHKKHVQKTEKKDWDQMRSYKVELSAATAERAEITEPSDLAGAVNLAHAFSVLSEGASGSRKNVMKEAVGNTKLTEILKKALEAKNWGTRFRALTAFHDFGSPSEFRLLLEFEYGEKNARVFGNGLMACAACISSARDFDDAILLMQATMEISASYYEGVFRVALRALEERAGRSGMIKHVSEVLLEKDVNPVLKASLVHAISKEGLHELKLPVLDLAGGTKDPVIIVAVLRALWRFNTYNQIIEENIGNPRRSLNVVALRASSTSVNPGTDLIRKIKEQLRSSDYVVRFAAASSLKQLGEKGEDALVRASSENDKYASDIASYILSVG